MNSKQDILNAFREMRIKFFKYGFSFRAGNRGKWLKIVGGVLKEYGDPTIEPKQYLVLYLPIPHFVSEGSFVRFRYILSQLEKEKHT